MSKLILPPHEAAAVAKKELEAAQHPKRCGNCWYGNVHPAGNSPDVLICEGGPPAVILIGVTNGPGGPQPQFTFARPTVLAGMRRCALWAERDLPGVPRGAEGGRAI